MVTKSFKGISPTGGPGSAIGAAALPEQEEGYANSNRESPITMPQPVAVSILLRAESSVGMNNDFSSSLSETQEGLGAGAAVHIVTTNNKSSGKRGADEHAMESRPPGSHPPAMTGAGSKIYPSTHNEINSIQTNAVHIKRTKKLAKSKTKSRARKLPTKKNKVVNDSVGEKLSAFEKPLAKARIGGKPATKSKGKKRLAKAKHPRPSPRGDPPKKRGRPKKKPKTEDKASNVGKGKSPRKEPPRETHPSVGKPQQVPSTITAYSDIESVVSAVVDVVADEIRHCSSMFAAKKRPMIVINNEEDLPNEKMPRHVHMQGKRSPKESIQATNESSTENGYSIRISEEGDIHAVKRSAHLTQPSKVSATIANQKCTTTTSSVPNAHLPQTGSDEAESDIDAVSDYDVSMVVMAVRRFALEVYCPFLLSAKKSMGNHSPNIDRIRLSTLLAIREMLIMNSEKLFDLPSLNGSPISTRERNYLSHIFVDAIIRNTAKHLHYSGQPGGHFLTDFIQATSNYDARSDDFQFALERADVRSVYVHPNNERVGHEESTLAKVSFNYARAKHPLLRDGEFTLKNGPKEMLVEKTRSITQPAASACAVFHIETASDETKVDDDDDGSAVLESLKTVLRSNS